MNKTDKLYKWAVFDRAPLPQWTKGRITLLGDSAHPMLPYLAQGACMASAYFEGPARVTRTGAHQSP